MLFRSILASGSDDNTVRLWDPTTGASLGVLPGHSSGVMVVAFSPDGKFLASGSDDNTVRLWDPTTGVSLEALQGHSETVKAMAFSADGKLLASGSLDNTVRLWDPTTGASLAVLQGHSDHITAVAFSPGSRFLASASGDKTVRLWSVKGTTIQVLPMKSTVQRLSFSPDGRSLKTDIEIEYKPLDIVDTSYQDLVCPPSLWAADGDWIVYRKQRLLWLPVDFRPHRFVGWGNSIAIGCRSGKVTVIQFDPNALPAGKLPNFDCEAISDICSVVRKLATPYTPRYRS